MSLFQVAPVKRRCWGLFQEESFDYKRLVGLGPKGFVVKLSNHKKLGRGYSKSTSSATPSKVFFFVFFLLAWLIFTATCGYPNDAE